MRKERIVLEEQADAALAAGEIDLFRGIEKDAAIERDAAAVGAFETRDAAQRHAFAGSGGAENGERIGVAGKFDIQIVAGEALFELDFESHISDATPFPLSTAGARDFAGASSNTCRRPWRGK